MVWILRRIVLWRWLVDVIVVEISFFQKIAEHINGPVDIKSYHLCDDCDVNFEKWIRGFENVKEELKDG